MLNNSPWDETIDALGDTARNYVKKNIGRGDGNIASELGAMGFNCTPESVRSIRRRLHRVNLGKSKTKSSATVTQTQNEIVAESNNSRIKTLEDLIRACDIDLDVWEIERHVINKWEVGAKGATSLVVEPLFQVKAWLIRKVPIAVTPVIVPVNISYTPAHRKIQKTSRTKRALILPDPQFGFRKDINSGALDPFHDRAALDVALQIATEYSIDKVVWLGDVLDLPDWSDKFVRSPEFHWTTQPAVIEAAWWLREFKVATGAETSILGGNHECFDSKTEILTKSGWKFHQDISPTDLVMTLNKESGNMEWQKPIAVHRYHHNGDMVSINTRGIDLCVTKNHRLWAKPTNISKWRMQPASDVLNDSRKRIYMRVSGSMNLSDVDLTDDEIRMAAWILTDGCIRKAGNHISCQIYQRKSKSHMISEIMDRMSWKYSTSERARNITHIMGKKLHSREPEITFQLLGESRSRATDIIEKQKKRLPSWAYTLSDRQFYVFLMSLIDGDGSRHKSNPETSLMMYGKYLFLSDLQAACVLHGYRATISEYRNDCWRLNINKSDIISADGVNKNSKITHYEGVVWCVTTPNDTVMVRRNGKPVVTGNSRMDRSINTHLIQAYNLKAADALDSYPAMSVPGLLGLKGLEIQYIADYPNGEVWINDQVRVIHGDVASGNSGATVARQIDDIQETTIQGHIHRVEHASKTLHTSKGPRAVSMWSVGCLCRIDGIVPGVKARQNWQQAIGIVDYTDTEHHVTAVPINNGKALYHGDVFSARNRVADLKRDTNNEWKF